MRTARPPPWTLDRTADVKRAATSGGAAPSLPRIPGRKPGARLGAPVTSFGRPLEIDRQIEEDETALVDIHHQGGPMVDAVVHIAGDRAP